MGRASGTPARGERRGIAAMRRARWTIVMAASLSSSAAAQTNDSLQLQIMPVWSIEVSNTAMPPSHKAALGSHARIRVRYCPVPSYPKALGDYGIEGRVLFQFVVDTLGRPELEDMVILEASNHALVPAARRAVAKCRYDAIAGGRPVRAVIQQGVHFRRDSTKSE